MNIGILSCLQVAIKIIDKAQLDQSGLKKVSCVPFIVMSLELC